MGTLYLRNVPDDVTDRLSALAAREGIAVSAFAVRELAALARRADNPVLLADLPDIDIDIGDVLEVLDEGRRKR
jgi:plasmid stability protein